MAGKVGEEEEVLDWGWRDVGKEGGRGRGSTGLGVGGRVENKEECQSECRVDSSGEQKRAGQEKRTKLDWRADRCLVESPRGEGGGAQKSRGSADLELGKSYSLGSPKVCVAVLLHPNPEVCWDHSS